MYNRILKIAAIAAMVTWSTIASAQQAEAPAVSFLEENTTIIMYALIAATLLVAMMVIIALAGFLLSSVDDLRNEILIQKGVITADEVEQQDVMSKLWDRLVGQLGDAVPIEQEEEIALDHNYDGIRELDNNLPPWWKMLFYGSIVWSIGYLFYYHVSGEGVLQAEAYEIAMEEAEREQLERLANAPDLVNEENVEVLADASAIDKGKQIYTINCVACHGPLGEGGVGPNFTDNYWIHGGGIVNIFKTIKYGVPEKGMISWQQQLKPTQMQQVASYIMTLEGTNPPNGKEPQGTIWVDETAPADTPVADSVDVPDQVIDDNAEASAADEPADAEAQNE